MEPENNNPVGQQTPSSMPESSGSKKGIVWLIVLVIIALIVVALTTGKKEEVNEETYNEEFLIDENASDEIPEIEADLEFEGATEDDFIIIDEEVNNL